MLTEQLPNRSVIMKRSENMLRILLIWVGMCLFLFPKTFIR